KRCDDSVSLTSDGFITLIAHCRFIFTCSARYTRPMPPSPSSASTRYRSAMTRPTSGSPPDLGRSGEPSFGQNRSPVSYSPPHWGQTLATATASSAVGVGCCARRPEPSPLCSSLASTSPLVRGAGRWSGGVSLATASGDVVVAGFSESRSSLPDMVVKCAPQLGLGTPVTPP